MKTVRKISTLLFILFFVSINVFPVSLNQLRIVADDGTFLGTFENEYSANSVYNQYGNYGSPYSNNSIMNQYGNYGSDYSDYSPFNKYANHAPWIVDRYGNSYGRLSVNKYASGVTNDSYRIALQLKALRDSF
jgi:hypothetical protein